MKIKMLEHFQGTGQPRLAEGEEYESVGSVLCAWLIEHGKAVEVKEAQKPAPKPLAKKAPKLVVEKAQEPVMQSKRPKRQTKKKGSKK